MDDVEIIDGDQGTPTTIRITGSSARRIGAKRQTIDPASGDVLSEDILPDEVATPDPAVRSKRIEMTNLIREKLNTLPVKEKLKTYGALSGAFGISKADDLQDLSNQINGNLSKAPFQDIQSLAKNLNVNLTKMKNEPKEIMDDQGNVMGIRKDMLTQKEMDEKPLNVQEQQVQLQRKVIKERRVKQLTEEINQNLDLEEIQRLRGQESGGFLDFFKNLFQKKDQQPQGAGATFMRAMTEQKAHAVQEVGKVEVPETGDTVSFPKQVGKYRIKEV